MKHNLKNKIIDEKISRWIQDDKFTIFFIKYAPFAIGLFLVFITLIPWVQTSYTKGKIVAYLAQERRFELQSPVDARLDQWLVEEGETVTKGQVLVKLLDNDPEIITRLEAEKNSLVAQYEALKFAHETSLLNVKRQKELLDAGIASKLTYESAKIESAKFEIERKKLSAELERFNVRLTRQSQQTILSPSDGVLVRIIKNATGGSQYVKAGDTLAIIAPDNNERAVEFWVSGIDMALISPGREVRIQFEGWPAIYFSGWPNYTYGTFEGEIKVVDALSNEEGHFRILVVPSLGKPWPPGSVLKQGMLAKGWVLLGKVTLGYEIWRQFNGFPKSFLQSKKNVYQENTLNKK